MYYVIHRGSILTAALSFSSHPGREPWLPGQILHFTTPPEALPADLEDAFLMDDLSDLAWHVEILAIVATPPAAAHSPALPPRDGVTIRLLRRLKAHEETLGKVRQHHLVEASPAYAGLGAA